MRIWTLSPKYIDVKGLVALWRETLLAKNVLLGNTNGYRQHPQLERFKNSTDPLLMINAYLGFVYAEANHRGYKFNKDKFTIVSKYTPIQVTDGQIKYELEHLRKKLEQRSSTLAKNLPKDIENIQLLPIFTIIEGEVESWEIRK